MSKLAFRAQTVDIANLPLPQDLLAKNVLMTAQRDFGLGNSLFIACFLLTGLCSVRISKITLPIQSLLRV
jgi:hypothetical protein